MYKRVVIVASALIISASAAPSPPFLTGFTNERIVGGEVTTIDQYPYQSALLQSWSLFFYEQWCGATILNARAILTAAHCFTYFIDPNHFRLRVGSTYANSGGIEHQVAQIVLHPSYNPDTYDNDIAIVRTTDIIVFNERVQPGVIAGPSYNVADNEPVWAMGWGLMTHNGLPSEQLRHVQVYAVNQALCRTRYMELGGQITNNMLCSGVIDEGGRDQCQGDSGGSLVHGGVVVGVCSWGHGCASERYPGVNARVSRYTSWIQANVV